ncbi:MAG: cyclic nucleotide-binding domain-containing protein [Paracoccaceae bacterium]
MSMRKGLIILGDLMDQDLIWLAKTGEVRRMGTGDVLIREGQRIEELFIVTEGWFDVSIKGQNVAKLSVGDVLGEMSFVEKQPPSATVSASESARVLAVPQHALIARFRTDQGFAARFYRALAVFLSDRLRTMMPGEAGAELDEGLLDTLHVAGDRMLRLIDLLEGRRTPA